MTQPMRTEKKDWLSGLDTGGVFFTWLDSRWFRERHQEFNGLIRAFDGVDEHTSFEYFERRVPFASDTQDVRRIAFQEAGRLLAIGRGDRHRFVYVVCHCNDGRSILLLNDGLRQIDLRLQQFLEGGASSKCMQEAPLLEAVPHQMAITAIVLAASATARYEWVRVHRFETAEGPLRHDCLYRHEPPIELEVGINHDVEAIIAASQLSAVPANTHRRDARVLPVYIEVIKHSGYPLLEYLPDPQTQGWRMRIEEREDGRVDVYSSSFATEAVSCSDLQSMVAYLQSQCGGPAASDAVPPVFATSPMVEHTTAFAQPQRGELIERFNQVAALQHDATALVFENSKISYRELASQSELLEQQIRATGVANRYVAICMQRTPAFIAAIIAVLKAGCAYIPIDPATPAQRRQAILKDCRAALLLTDSDNTAETQTLSKSITVQRLDQFIHADSASEPNGIAYVIYTSGSTGVPKGVAVPHHNVVALVDACQPLLDLRPNDVWTLFHSMAFDFSVWEMWGALLTGATLVIVPYWTSRDPLLFTELVRKHDVTVLSQTPSAFNQFISQVIAADVQIKVRLVVFGGEKLVKAKLIPWFDRFPESRCRLVNMYGITETTVHVTHETVTRCQALEDQSSVGEALPGWSLGICDKAGLPLPSGLTGEICVYGVGLARGYLNRPELTTSRFDIDPISGHRRYRSGDRGRLDRNGKLFHYGRIDNQIKLRGFRIELGDIATQIRQIQGVTDAAVLLDEGDGLPGSAVLRAFVITDSVRTATIRARLNEQLPDYMRPSSISLVECFPMNNNGKLDGKKLLADYRPEAEQSLGSADSAVAADAGLEEQYRSVWMECFGTPVSAHDNFFDLGGNSLIAIKINQRLRALRLPEISLKDIYVHQNIAAIASATAIQ